MGQQDLFPDGNLVPQAEFAAQAPGAELGMGEAHDVNRGASRGAEQAETGVMPVQRPADGGAVGLTRVGAADLVVDGEAGIGEAGAQLHPLRLGKRNAPAGDAAHMRDMDRPVIAAADGGHVLGHDRRQDIGQLLAQRVVVAAALIGAGQVNSGGEGAPGLLRPALTRDRGARPGLGAVAQLAHHRPHVVAQPFVGDHIVLNIAIGDAAGGHHAAGRRAENAVAGMGADDHRAVGRQIAAGFIARPDHVIAIDLPVGEGGKAGQRIVDHIDIAGHHAQRAAGDHVLAISLMQRGDLAAFPDFPGDALDVIGKICEARSHWFSFSLRSSRHRRSVRFR